MYTLLKKFFVLGIIIFAKNIKDNYICIYHELTTRSWAELRLVH